MYTYVCMHVCIRFRTLFINDFRVLDGVKAAWVCLCVFVRVRACQRVYKSESVKFCELGEGRGRIDVRMGGIIISLV